MTVGRSFTNMTNKRGPRIEPWGTPSLGPNHDEEECPLITLWSRFPNRPETTFFLHPSLQRTHPASPKGVRGQWYQKPYWGPQRGLSSSLRRPVVYSFDQNILGWVPWSKSWLVIFFSSCFSSNVFFFSFPYLCSFSSSSPSHFLLIFHFLSRLHLFSFLLLYAPVHPVTVLYHHSPLAGQVKIW